MDKEALVARLRTLFRAPLQIYFELFGSDKFHVRLFRQCVLSTSKRQERCTKHGRNSHGMDLVEDFDPAMLSSQPA